MPNKLRETLAQAKIAPKLFTGLFGVEVEEHRITTDGRLSRYPYPSKYASRKTHPYLQSDFTDSMLELVTEPTKGGLQAIKNLKILQQISQEHLNKDERIWPFSMPPKLVDDDLEFAHNNFSRDWFQTYRDYLERKYGIEHEIICGTHINYSLNEDLVYSLYHEFHFNEKYPTFAAFRNATYFKLAQSFALYRWFFTYLFGASPLSENHYRKLPEDLKLPVRSLRSSSLGYSNTNKEAISYDSLTAQVEQMENYVNDGTFYSIHEFYGPVRLKGRSDDLRKMLDDGVDYLEFRAFDLDPLSRAGVSDDTLDLLELFLVYSLVTDLPSDLPKRLAESLKLNEEVALENPNEQPDWLQTRATELINNLHLFAEQFRAPEKYLRTLAIAEKRVANVKLTIGAQLASRVEDNSLVTYGLKIANDRYASFLNASQPLVAIANDYSRSAQQLIKAAIIMGIRVQLHHGFKLTMGNHHELFEAQMNIEFPNGPEEYLRSIFAELSNPNEK
ncbi:glutamate--cysteine ligase [Paucilactobacillus kaifaensis]|uniref:glutamate--cysteine ligase n=1 Tax=Paucilactobacillus kaifaensis TaxID=2559921 RepID=UPI0010F826C5|nr:glutamate--cysteine ligase [Paucilactobacillus kaifaensis]